MENPIKIDDFGGTIIFGNIHLDWEVNKILWDDSGILSEGYTSNHLFSLEQGAHIPLCVCSVLEQGGRGSQYILIYLVSWYRRGMYRQLY